MNKKFVSVIFPLALPKPYTYEVPEHLYDSVSVGIRVEVSLKNKLYAAIVIQVDEDLELTHKVKPIISVLDDLPIVTRHQINLWQWIAEYYCCTIGEVMGVAMPSGLKLESETKVVFNGNLEDESMHLSDDEYLIAEAVSIQNELTIAQIQDILNKKTIYPVLRGLIDRRIIVLKEELIEKFKPKQINIVSFCEPYRSNSELITEAYDLVIKSEKQTKALLAFIQLANKNNGEVPVTDIYQLAAVDSAVIKAMVNKNIFVLNKKTASRIGLQNSENDILETSPELSDQQIIALEEIDTNFKFKKPVLLHGVTGSGKTRVFVELIKREIENNSQCLYLLPEIALTTHLVERLKGLFGTQVLIYHSRMSNHERVEVWNAVMMGAKIVVAARSGLYLPFQNLGLIIVDEEHDPSYKQNEPNPRYNARDVAVFMSLSNQCKIILGSATPSLESYHNTQQGKFGLVKMTERFGDSILPEVQIVDIKEAYKQKNFDGLFSKQMIDTIQESLDNKKQILLFINRRGFAPTLHCTMCDWKAFCTNCDVHMTVHKAFQELRCHYCGTRAKMPKQCPACGCSDLVQDGFGTEKVEEAIQVYFPSANIARLDHDTARTKLAFETILYDFEQHAIDILVGTQMVTKGLDFGNIALVGVLNADTILRYPDLRAGERAFQLLTQVAGRAGRRSEQGKVIIQTYDPYHPVIVETVENLYERFVHRESEERKLFLYPPFFRLIQLEMQHKNAAVVAQAADHLVNQLKPMLGNRIIGPATPSISRVRNMYLQTVIIKMEKDNNIVKKIKKTVKQYVDAFKTIPGFKTVRVLIDVDPY